MKIVIFLGLLACYSGLVVADQKGCLAAVDAADSLNVNATSNCDYSKEGLNGYLHKSFKNTSSIAVERPAETKSSAASGLRIEVEQWAAIPLARNQFLSRAFELSPKGFNVLNEAYRPLMMGRIELNINIECIN